jgi:phosphoribosylformimino-5-aminoimidazole carboxamide ribotide isomerase
VGAVILYPAIDLKDGQCVRLLHGDMDKVTVFNASPAAQAASFEAEGFEYLHMVDLNGAIEGRNVNGAAVRAVLQTVSMPVQIGGGIRSLANIEDWLEAGVARVILGTAAVRDPDLVKHAARRFPGKVAVGIDARDGMVATQGWVETSTVSAIDLARKFEDAGVAAIIFTDIARDGALTGVNVAATGQLADSVSIPVIASGGIASVRDITDLKARQGTPIAGAILGRSLYVGAVKPGEALVAARA